jgi:O-acetyl-ADP-ribose deacetylase (regulator of RNase III)
VRSALDLADEHGLGGVSMPGISSGIFGFPKPLCAQVMLRTIRDWLSSHPDSTVHEVNTCNIDALTSSLFRDEARRQFPERGKGGV